MAKATRATPKRRTSSAKKGRPMTKKAQAPKRARKGKVHVDFGLRGLATIMHRVSDAGLGPALKKALGKDDTFVKVQRESLGKIKSFIDSKPELADLAREIADCDCPADDPGCVYI